MEPQAWLTLAIVGVMFTLLAFTAIGPDLVLLAALTALVTFNAVPVEDAIAGFGNEGVVTVGVLFVIASALSETGAIGMLVEPLLGRPKTVLGAQARFIAPVAALSAFINNTPLVAMMMPVVSDWSKKNNLAPSKLMIPLSYAAILGGVCTMIGTSTNLVVNGLLTSQTDHPGLKLLDISPVGIPIAIVGLAYILVASRWLLPDRRPAISQGDDPREYTVEMMVAPDGPLAGQTIEKAGLRHLPGMFLVEIDREGEILAAVGPQERLRANDRLVFAGVVESVVDLQKIRGLAPATDQLFKLDAPRAHRCLIEAVVAPENPVVGRTIRDGRFRALYNAVVVAVGRGGKRINKKIGDIVLQAGDTLLLEAHPSFAEERRNSRDFYLVSTVEGSAPPRHDKSWISLGIMLGMVVAAATGFLSMLNAAMIAAGLMIATRCISGAGARRSVDWPILMAIGASLGIGKAMLTSGAAKGVAGILIGLAGGHPWMSLLVIYYMTLLFTEILTNNAAAALVFPIAISTAAALHVAYLPFVVAVMIAASAGFATPLGYQTHLMVYGPGGYRFSDFLRFGIPLDILVGLVAVPIIPLVFPF